MREYNIHIHLNRYVEMIYISTAFDLLISDYCRHKTFTEFKKNYYHNIYNSIVCAAIKKYKM